MSHPQRKCSFGPNNVYTLDVKPLDDHNSVVTVVCPIHKDYKFIEGQPKVLYWPESIRCVNQDCGALLQPNAYWLQSSDVAKYKHLGSATLECPCLNCGTLNKARVYWRK